MTLETNGVLQGEHQIQLSRWQDAWNSRAGEERSVRVRWLLNPNEEPRANIEVTEFQGTIVDLRTITGGEQSGILPLAFIPPLINAHTHLEFSSIRTPLSPAAPFPEWIRSVMKWRQSNNAESSLAAGAQESYDAGVRVLGEIATGDSLVSHKDFPGTIVSFREAIGLSEARIAQQLDQAGRYLGTPSEPGRIRGVSPHAPYTVHPELLRGLVDLAIEHQAPLAMHLAETQDEIELLATGSGRFAEFLNGLGLFHSSVFPGNRSVLECLRELARAPRALAVHGNYFSEHDIEFLAGHPQITTVYCPRTHKYFGHPIHPFRKLLSAGCRVILGTDSRASNPDLSVFRELQLLARIAPEIRVPELLAMATTHSANALGTSPDACLIRNGGPFEPLGLSFDPELSSPLAILQNADLRVISIQ